MHRTTIHIASFGIDYRNPQQSNVLSSIKICINNINFTFVIGTLKDLVISFSNMFTGVAGFRSVSRFYNHQFNTIKQRLVLKKGTQLSEIPTSEFCSKLFVSPFGSKTDIGQILDGNTFTLFFSRIYNAFCNSVINYGSRCSFFAREPFQQLFSVACAFALNRTTNLLSLLPIGINPVGRMFNPIRCNDNISETEIHTDKGFNIVNVLFRNINGLKEVEFTLFVNQICFPLNVRQISRIMTNKIDFLPTTDTPQRNNIIGLICHNTGIISNTSKWSKGTFGFLVKFISISNFCNRANQHLRRKFERGFINVVNFVMEFEIVKDLFRPSNFRNSVANCICFPNSVKKQISLFSSWKKFDFQSQFHDLKIQFFSDIRKYLIEIIYFRRTSNTTT